MTVKVKVREYLEELEHRESVKPAMQQRPIPSIPDMAKAAGVRRQTMHSFLEREEHKRLDLEIVNAIITQLRRYGHNTQLTDILEYVEE